MLQLDVDSYPKAWKSNKIPAFMRQLDKFISRKIYNNGLKVFSPLYYPYDHGDINDMIGADKGKARGYSFIIYDCHKIIFKVEQSCCERYLITIHISRAFTFIYKY